MLVSSPDGGGSEGHFDGQVRDRKRRSYPKSFLKRERESYEGIECLEKDPE